MDEEDTDPLLSFETDLDALLMWADHYSGLDENVYTARYTLICEHYKDLCDRTERKDFYTPQQQYYFQALMIYLIKSLDESRQVYAVDSLRDILSYIRLYKDPTARRWSAGTTHVKMNTEKIDSYREFREVFTHEVWWHIHDLGVLKDEFSPILHPEYTEFGKPTFWLNDRSLKFYSISWLDENTRKWDASYLDFVSGYAMKDTFEELAEFTNAWINHHDLLLALTEQNTKMKQKYELFEELFGDWYYDADSEQLAIFDVETRVFDSTKVWK